MRHALAFLLLLALAAPAPAQEARNPGIERVITSQIEAFLADDFETAFTFAAPAIRRIFRTPENFGRMVREGYPMVWRPARVEFLTLERRDGLLVQRVLIEDAAGAYYVAEYIMVEGGDGWQINGVRIERAGEMAA